MTSQTLGKVGYEKGMAVTRTSKLTRQGAKYQTYRDEPVESEDTSPYPSFPKIKDPGISNVPILGMSGYGDEGFGGAARYGQGAPHPIHWIQGVRIGDRKESPIQRDRVGTAAAEPDSEPVAEEVTVSTSMFTKLSTQEVKDNFSKLHKPKEGRREDKPQS